MAALLGTAVAGVIQLLNSRQAIKKEENQWRHQHEADKEAREIKQREAHRQQIVDVYQSSIQSLSTFFAAFDSIGVISTLPEKEKVLLRQDAFKWLTLLSIHLSSSGQGEREKFHRKFEDFAQDPNHLFTNLLLSAVLKLSKTDSYLFPGLEVEEEKKEGHSVQIDIDASFRQKQFESGTELPAHYWFLCDLAELEEIHRIKIWEVFFTGKIPEHLCLSLPTNRSENNAIEKTSRAVWQAKLNPHTSSRKDIFDAWVESYEAAWAEAQDLKDSASNK